jgi:hypothetical protein
VQRIPAAARAWADSTLQSGGIHLDPHQSTAHNALNALNAPGCLNTPQRDGGFLLRYGMRVKVAPGIRIGMTSRGLRTSIGPRGARLHLGGGPATMSTGFGPFTAWSRLGSKHSPARRGTKRHPTRRSVRDAVPQRPPNLEMLQRQAAAALRADEIERVRTLEHSLVSAHTADCPPALRPVAPESVQPSLKPFVHDQTMKALKGIPRFALSRRREARKNALQAAEADWQQAKKDAQQDHDWVQKLLDQQWQARLDHDPDVVHDILEKAFADHQMHATVLDVGVDHEVETGVRYATVAVLFGTADLVPATTPDLTPTGRPTLRTRTKTERNAFYLKALGSTVLATVREGFAIAPSVDEFRIVVLRQDPHASIPDRSVEWIYGALFPRGWASELSWNNIDPGQALSLAPHASLKLSGQTGDIDALPLDQQPQLAKLVQDLRDEFAKSWTPFAAD